ncbi:putative transcriptional regulator [Clostridium sp. CAG:567]|jgi:putative transcriptional regulator|nr:putative transcriptional regulator [Clostridium sp. CAG:567]
MIKIKLSDLLGKHKMTQKSLADATHIRPATISKMYYEETKRIDVQQLNNICKVFNCEISDLLEYIPDTKDK